MKRYILILPLVCSPAYPQVISLEIGNEYYRWSGSFSAQFSTPSGGVGGPATSSGYFDKIVADTVINGMRYFVFANRSPLLIERCDSSRVYAFENGVEVVVLDYAVTIGSRVTTRGHGLIVESVQLESVFGDTQLVITATNLRTDILGRIIRFFMEDQVVTFKYAKKYGFILFQVKEGNSSYWERLTGGIISDARFGTLY